MDWFRNRRNRGRPRHPDVLTPAEWRVLEHVREGATNAEIAVRLGVSINTVRYHVSSMLAKLELGDRHALAAWDGEPREASRAALGRTASGRSGLAAPFALVRDALTATWLAKVAVGAGVVALSAAAVYAISSLKEAGDVGGAEPVVSAPVTSPSSPASIATPSATAMPGVPTLNVAHAFTPQPTAIALVPDGDPDGFGQPFIYDSATGEVFRMAGVDGSPTFLQPSPHSDVLLAWSVDGTVLYDLELGSAQLLVPVHVRVHHWIDEHLVLVTVATQQPGSPGAGWPAGLYKLDLDSMTITLQGALVDWLDSLSPDGRAVLVVEHAGERWHVVSEAPDGSQRHVIYETEGDRHAPTASWAPDSSRALVIDGNRLHVVDLRDGSLTALTGRGEAAGARALIYSVWSSDSRYIALIDVNYETWIVDTLAPDVALGPFPRVWPWAWHPSEPELLALAQFCVADGFHPAIIDAPTGAISVETDVSGIWYQAWSPDGSALVAGVGATVHLLDGATLAPRGPAPRRRRANARWRTIRGIPESRSRNVRSLRTSRTEGGRVSAPTSTG